MQEPKKYRVTGMMIGNPIMTMEELEQCYYLNADTLLWEIGSSDWQPIQEFPNLVKKLPPPLPETEGPVYFKPEPIQESHEPSIKWERIALLTSLTINLLLLLELLNI